MAVSISQSVIFKREMLTTEFLTAYGTSAVYSSYKVEEIDGDSVVLMPEYGFPFPTSVNAIESVPTPYDKEALAEPFMGMITRLENATS